MVRRLVSEVVRRLVSMVVRRLVSEVGEEAGKVLVAKSQLQQSSMETTKVPLL